MHYWPVVRFVPLISEHVEKPWRTNRSQYELLYTFCTCMQTACMAWKLLLRGTLEIPGIFPACHVILPMLSVIPTLTSDAREWRCLKHEKDTCISTTTPTLEWWFYRDAYEILWKQFSNTITNYNNCMGNRWIKANSSYLSQLEISSWRTQWKDRSTSAIFSKAGCAVPISHVNTAL